MLQEYEAASPFEISGRAASNRLMVSDQHPGGALLDAAAFIAANRPFGAQMILNECIGLLSATEN